MYGLLFRVVCGRGLNSKLAAVVHSRYIQQAGLTVLAGFLPGSYLKHYSSVDYVQFRSLSVNTNFCGVAFNSQTKQSQEKFSIQKFSIYGISPNLLERLVIVISEIWAFTMLD